MANITRASDQWATRPDDERFLTLKELLRVTKARRALATERVLPANSIRIESRGLGLQALSAGRQEMGLPGAELTNWSFRQLCYYAGAPSGYLRTLPNEISARALEYSLIKRGGSGKVKTLGIDGSEVKRTLRAVTGENYGRIWDCEVVQAAIDSNQHGNWKVPSASYSKADPLRATTLYSSDRDMFIFLVDPSLTVDIGDEHLFRGYYMWNSEVGASTWGLSTFLYRYVCDNRIIWGAQEMSEITIRHTKNAPQKFREIGLTFLRKFTEASTAAEVKAIRYAMNNIPDVNENGCECLADWLIKRGLTPRETSEALTYATWEMGQVTTYWDIVNGITASARQVGKTDKRLKLERIAGKIMAEVAVLAA